MDEVELVLHHKVVDLKRMNLCDGRGNNLPEPIFIIGLKEVLEGENPSFSFILTYLYIKTYARARSYVQHNNFKITMLQGCVTEVGW